MQISPFAVLCGRKGADGSFRHHHITPNIMTRNLARGTRHRHRHTARHSNLSTPHPPNLTTCTHAPSHHTRRTIPHRTFLNNNLLAMSSDTSAGDGAVTGDSSHAKKGRTDREFQHDGPVEDEEAAREKMKEAGFDPDDVTKECTLSLDARKAINMDFLGFSTTKIGPMAYFCRIGDLKMCRYLLSKGASTTATNASGWWFPMYTAALGSHLDVCEWLYDHGAEEDVCRQNFHYYTPLYRSFYGAARSRSQACCRWLILKGVLSLDDKPGVVCPRLMRRDIAPRRVAAIVYDARPQLLEWAQQSVQTHSGFVTFLLGTLPAPAFTRAALHSLLAERLQSKDAAEIFICNTPEDQCRLAWEKIAKTRFCSPAIALGEKTGILELIADYVGVVRGRDLRILRSLVDPLSDYLEEVPFRPERGRGRRDRGVRE